ncbi:MAG TPA: secretin N-terminal domain-containing protein [Bacteroidia bacterium]|jgi:type IV pilus assembly protein PilQ|nr:secretin N-terminal domain-containing protein [Bacteroidia bacterium]
MHKSEMLFRHIFLLLLLLLFIIPAMAQDRYATIENKLKEIAVSSPGLNEKVELSVNGSSLQEFIRGLATTNNLNVSIDAGLNAKVYNNFTNVTVSDVLLFLIRKYDLDVTFVGNIISFTQFVQPAVVAPVVAYVPKALNISYDKTTDLLTMDLSQDSLVKVAKEITKVSDKNVVFSPDLAGKVVNGYIQKMNFSSALDKFAFANDLKVTTTADNVFLIEKIDATSTLNQPNSKIPRTSRSNNSNNNNVSADVDVKTNAEGLLSVIALNTPVADILAAASREKNIQYYLFSEVKGNTSVNIKNENFDDFLMHLFNGTDYTFKKDNDLYLIGERTLEGLRTTKVISLRYRTVEKVIDFIPADLKKGVEVKAFNDQNSLIVSGSQKRIDEIESFLRDIDRVVPVISIEVIIVDVNHSNKVATGISAGLGDKPTTTGGSVFPSIDLRLGAGAINSVIDGINGTGIVNLGKVTPNFYMSLKLMEQNGDVKINSTPLLSTLNGNEAKMSIGETRYYQENNTNTITTQSTTTVQSVVYKPLEAKFSMSINPIVSGDEQITLEISVVQSTFTNQSGGPNSPFNTSSRDFKSLIRVKNQEMIMLGGLDNDNKSETGTGLPILSRIPIIKWIFSAREKSRTKAKLTIFIKPTVIY